MRIKSVAVLFTILYCSITYAIPAVGDTLVVKQPDGTSVKVRVFGDEFYRRVETLDGYTLIRNNEKWICYAQKTRSGDSLSATEMIYDGSQKRMVGFEKSIDISDDARNKRIDESREKTWGDSGPWNEPVRQESGTIVGATILIDFPDDTATISVQDMNDFMNKPGFSLNGNNGSVRDYYLDMSKGQLDYSNKVVGYYRAQHPKSYYEENNLKLLLIDEAYRGVDSIFDFSECTYNIKAVKAVNILYAGACNSAWGEGLWPHAGSHRFETDEGLILSKYQMAAIDTGLAIGPTIHENAHMLLNLSDLYDSKGETYGVGYYALMCYGCFTPNPAPINAYFRELAGWETPTDITDATEGTEFSHETNSLSSFVYRNPSNTREAYYIESRRKEGRNTFLPDEGLMIWHVDSRSFTQSPGMTANKHFMVSLEQADGNFDLELKVNPGDTTDLFKAGRFSEFSDDTSPGAQWWKGEKSGLKLTNISDVGETMSFTFGDGSTALTSVNPKSISGITATTANNVVVLSGYALYEVKIYSLNGKLISTAKLGEVNQAKITHSLSTGMYLFAVASKSAEGVKTNLLKVAVK